MSAEELDTLRAEAAPAPEEVPATEPPQEIYAPVDPGLSKAMTIMVAGLSSPICRRANVTGLDYAEAEMLGTAIAQLVTVYDLGPKDPRGAAWMGLAIAAGAVLSGRRPLAPKDAETPKEEDVPPAPVFGSTGEASLGVVNQPVDAVPCA